MENNLNIAEITDLTSIPANAIIVTYSDHYMGNSGDRVYLSDGQGKDAHTNGFLNRLELHTFMDDRGVISAKAITHERGAFVAFNQFRFICGAYVGASNALKLWDKGDTIWNQDGFEHYGNCGSRNTSFTGNFDASKFENSGWFRKVSKRSKPETIAKKKMAFEAEQKKRNEYIRGVLVSNKEKAAEWFTANKISLRVAYMFVEGYY